MILIDIEMPEKCGLCPCFYPEYPIHCQLIKFPDKDKRIVAPYGLPRPEWCPLKEQEAVEPIRDDDGYYRCRSCNAYVAFPNGDCKKSFCEKCGTAVKWNE